MGDNLTEYWVVLCMIWKWKPRTEKEIMLLSIYCFWLIFVLLNMQVSYNTVVLVHTWHISIPSVLIYFPTCGKERWNLECKRAWYTLPHTVKLSRIQAILLYNIRGVLISKYYYILSHLKKGNSFEFYWK